MKCKHLYQARDQPASAEHFQKICENTEYDIHFTKCTCKHQFSNIENLQSFV